MFFSVYWIAHEWLSGPGYRHNIRFKRSQFRFANRQMADCRGCQLLIRLVDEASSVRPAAPALSRNHDDHVSQAALVVKRNRTGYSRPVSRWARLASNSTGKAFVLPLPDNCGCCERHSTVSMALTSLGHFYVRNDKYVWHISRNRSW